MYEPRIVKVSKSKGGANMAASKTQDELIDEFVAERNKNRGRVIIPQMKEIPPQMECWYGAIMNEYLTTDVIRHYCDGIGDWQNPLWHDEDYARNKTRWGGIVAPPTIGDAIVQPYAGPMLTDEEIKESPFKSSFTLPNCATRWLYQVFRPGDRFHVIMIDMGLTEIKPARRPSPAREFDDVMRRLIFNQREELVSVHDRHMEMVVNHELGDNPFWIAPGEKGKRKFRKITNEERDAIIQGYENMRIRGEERLYWEDVKVGETVWPLTVGPLSAYDNMSAYGCIVPGHGACFDSEWQRIKRAFHFHSFNEEINMWECSGVCHVIPDAGKHAKIFTGGPPVAFYCQMEGLLGRMITNWMGDDGFLAFLDVRMPIIPIVGEVIGCRGKVINKRIENGEHLVDLDIHIENQDKVVLLEGKATIRLISRDDYIDVNKIPQRLV